MNTEPDTEGYKNFIDDINKREISNAESFDKALLTLSSAFLGLSITFIKNIVALESASSIWVLYLSWALFAVTIVLTVLSFMYGQYVIRQLKLGAKKYFIERDTSVNDLSERLSENIVKFNLATGTSFIIAVLTITIFVVINVESNNMGPREDTPTQSVPDETRSQPVPSFDQVPQSPPTQPPPQQDSGGQSESNA